MIRLSDPGSATVEIILFELSGAHYGADASQVLRIDRAPAGGQPMGDGQRALVVRDSEGGCRPIPVDAVHGLRTIPVASLRRLPSAIDMQGVAVGVWLNGDTPVVLLDLLELLKRQGGQ